MKSRAPPRRDFTHKCNLETEELRKNKEIDVIFYHSTLFSFFFHGTIITRYAIATLTHRKRKPRPSITQRIYCIYTRTSSVSPDLT